MPVRGDALGIVARLDSDGVVLELVFGLYQPMAQRQQVERSNPGPSKGIWPTKQLSVPILGGAVELQPRCGVPSGAEVTAVLVELVASRRRRAACELTIGGDMEVLDRDRPVFLASTPEKR